MAVCTKQVAKETAANCPAFLIWRIAVRGSYRGRKLDALFEGDDEGCGSPLALEAFTVLSEVVPPPISTTLPKTAMRTTTTPT
jgi:hypothetical protein